MTGAGGILEFSRQTRITGKTGKRYNSSVFGEKTQAGRGGYAESLVRVGMKTRIQPDLALRDNFTMNGLPSMPQTPGSVQNIQEHLETEAFKSPNHTDFDGEIKRVLSRLISMKASRTMVI